MDITELLEAKGEEIVAESFRILHRANKQHYEESGPTSTRWKLRTLFDLTLSAVKERNLTPILEHAQAIGEERFMSGYDLSEVQTSFNALEETIWKTIFEEMDPSQYSEALGLVSTALGAGKDVLARTYVSLASRTKAPSLDLRSAFEGPPATVAESW